MVHRFLERTFVIVLFLYLMGVATSLLYADQDHDEYMALQGSLHLPITLIQVAISLVGALLIATRWRRVAGAAIKAWPLLGIAGLQVLSIAWSIHPLITLRKDVLELIMVAIGIYLGERYTTAELSKLLVHVLCIAMGAIVVLLAVAPRFVLDADQHNALKGLSQNKNGFGFYIGLTVALLILLRFRRYNWLRLLGIPLAVVMLLLSRSMTSVASAFIIITTLPFWFVVRLRARQRAASYVVLATGLTVIGVLGALYSPQLLAIMGKDSTLTGRTEVWNQLLVAISHHPFLGYGYGAFWTGLSGESLDVYVVSGWMVPSAHNAYLELWLALGIPGLVTAAIAFWQAFRFAIEYIRTERGWATLWPVACISFILVHGIGESEFIYDSSFAGCLFTALYTSLVLRRAHERSSAFEVPLPYSEAMPLSFAAESRSATVQS